MAKLVSVPEMVAIEKAADAAGLSYAQMMENAGQALADALMSRAPQEEFIPLDEDLSEEIASENSVLALIGKGNNGGDALVALETLAEQGWQVAAYLLGERNDEYVQRVRELDGEVVAAGEDKDYSQLDRLLEEYTWLLDGLLGTGITLPLRKDAAGLLTHISEQLDQIDERPYIVAVDCPSGMDADSGEVADETLKADITVSMAAVKRGMLSLPALEYLGQLEVGNIGLTEDLAEWSAVKRVVVDENMVAEALPERPRDGHKGTFGTALVVAGSRRYPGAALLASEAAYACGTGLVSVATPSEVQAMLAGHLPEATWQPLSASEGWLDAEAAKQLDLEGVDALLLGPGWGMEVDTGEFLRQTLEKKLPPLVVDADGLKLLAEIESWPDTLPADSVLTPHPGEMSILSGLSVDEIQADRIALAERHAKEWGHVLVLKGAFTVIAAPDGRTALLALATPALATAGTGDVLAGLITGLRAQGLAAFEAAYAAAWLHGQAGLWAAERLGGTAGVLAGDLLYQIPALIGK